MEPTAAFYFCAAAIIIVTVLFAYKRLLIPSNNLQFNLPPSGPFAIPIIGHLHLLKLPLHRSLARIAANHGPLLLLRFGARPILVVTSPAIAEECFTKNDIIFANRPVDDNSKLLTYDYISLGSAPYSPYWRNLRRITNSELFSPSRLAALSSLRAKEIRHLVRQLAATTPGYFQRVKLKPKFKEMLLNIIMQPLAGKRYSGESGSAVREEGQRILGLVDEIFRLSEVSNIEDLLPFLKKLGFERVAHKQQLLKVKRETDVLFQEMVDERRRLARAATQGEETSRTIIDAMLSLQATDPEYYTDIVIKGVILTLLTAGIESTTGTMEWAMSLLLNNPKSLEKLRAEIETQVGHSRLVADSDLPHLPYLNNVIKETLRLFPVAPFLIPHCSSSHCKLNDYDIPAGTTLFVNVFAMNRDPSSWREPTRFMPNRFEAGEGEGNGFIPFGSGRRRCPGDVLAGRLMGLTLGTLVQCFDWERVGGMEVDLTEAGTLTIHKVIPLEAMYKPRADMVDILSQI